MRIRGTLGMAWVAALMATRVACGGSPIEKRPAGLEVNVTISGGQVTPTNATLAGSKCGQQITLHVTSDATDELHVHSSPDHKFQVAAAPNQTFQFSVDVPGNVEVELHHLDRTIADHSSARCRELRARGLETFQVLAHGLGGSGDLPVPYAYAMVGAAWALTFTFALVAFAWRRPRFDPPQAGPPACRAG